MRKIEDIQELYEEFEVDPRGEDELLELKKAISLGRIHLSDEMELCYELPGSLQVKNSKGVQSSVIKFREATIADRTCLNNMADKAGTAIYFVISRLTGIPRNFLDQLPGRVGKVLESIFIFLT